MSTRTFTFTVQAPPTGDWIAQYLINNPLAAGQWSEPLDMQGLHAQADPSVARNAGSSTITAISRANPCVITTASTHSYIAGDRMLFVAGTTGANEMDGAIYTAAAVTPTTVTINYDSSSITPYATTGGSASIKHYPNLYTASLPFQDYSGHQMLDWNGQFYYDATTGLHQVGGGVGSGGGRTDSAYQGWYLRYDPRTNVWYKRLNFTRTTPPIPPWNPINGDTSHQYCSYAMDTRSAAQGGTRRYFRRGVWFNMDDPNHQGVDTNEPSDGGTANTYVFHEALGRLYRITSDGRLRYWTPGGGWTALLGTYPGMAQHPISSYHVGMGVAVFGGGNTPANGLYEIDSSGTIRSIGPIPATVGSRTIVGASRSFNVGSSSSAIMDVGFASSFVVFVRFTENGDGVNSYIPTETYRLTRVGVGNWTWSASADAIPAKLATPFPLHPVTTTNFPSRELGCAAVRHLGVVMVLVENDNTNASYTDADLRKRRCAVYLYRPSGN